MTFDPSQFNIGGLTLRADMINGPAKLDQMTFCFRINIDFFALTGVYHYILQIMDGGEPSDPFDERGVEFGLRDPLTNHNLFRLTSFVAEKYEMRRVGNKDWHWPAFASPVHVRDWQHFCVSYSASHRRIRMMHNSDLEVDHVRPTQVEALDDFIPSGWFAPFQKKTVQPVSIQCTKN